MVNNIYLDNAATTYVKKEVFDEMLPYFSEEFGNASSVYTLARTARKAVEVARKQVADAIGATPGEIYFTSGGTEADNWAIKGLMERKGKGSGHIITSTIEHHAVLHTCQTLERKGYDVTYLPVDENGLVAPQSVKEALRDDTLLVTIMFANNEIGTIEPIEEIGAICRAHKVAFHTDAVQAIGNVEIDVAKMNIDMLSLTAHKMYGPKGIGALYIRKGIVISPLIEGGAQEKGKRGGTYNHTSIVGLGKAIEIATSDIASHNARLTVLRDKYIERILTEIPHSILNGHPTKRLSGNVNISIKYIEGEGILLNLDMVGIAASSGSACTSGSLDPSHVLLAIGLDHGTAHGSLRISLGDRNNEDEIDIVLENLITIVQRLRAMSPLYNGGK